MNNNELFYGFKHISSHNCKDIDAKMHIFEHIKSGARLCHLERADECKTFAISFRTIPTDNTGVFHIIEHSVLCGSEKYPTKEPFADMMKSSLNTYLNAMTYPDKTVYPVSSKNDKDFYNLVSVYMDAVFHPLSVRSSEAYRQEGWRYELSPEGEVIYNGVVYSEMKGAYSSPDEIAERYMSTLLFPGGTYSYDSGGDPDYITDLTFEGYKEAHEKHYHPSNAFIVLDGEIKEDIFALLDSYLSGFEKRECDIKVDLGGEIITEPITISYELDSEEDATDKTRVLLGYITSDASESTKSNAISSLFDAIADTNASILKRRILETGLCTGVSVYPMTGLVKNMLHVEFKNVKDGCAEEIVAAFDRILDEIIEEGVDEKLIEASIDLTEFRTREADFGSFPKGMVYTLALLDSVNNDLPPEDTFLHTEEFDELRKKLNTGYYISLLRELRESKRATLVLTPDKELATRREEKTAARIESYLSTLSDADKEELLSSIEHFAEWQMRENTEEELASIPRLSLSDLAAAPEKIDTAVYKERGATVLEHRVATGGIVYTELHFNTSDITPRELSYLALFTSAYHSLDTESGSASDFGSRAKSTLGELSITVSSAKRDEDIDTYLTIRFSHLSHKRESALLLIREALYGKLLDNPSEFLRIARQSYLSASEKYAQAGHALALRRSSARYSKLDCAQEYIVGYEYTHWLGELLRGGEGAVAEVISKVQSILERALVRERLTASITARDEKGYRDALLSVIKNGEALTTHFDVKLLPRRNEGIVISSQVAHTAYATNLFLKDGGAKTGHNSLISEILSYNTLWENVRVKGGAYGAGLSIKHNSGGAIFYSYRTPNPKANIETFRSIGEAVGIFDEIDLESSIIAAMGSHFGQVRTPSMIGSSATAEYLANKSHDDIIELWESIRYATREDLKHATEHLASVIDEGTVTVVASREMLATLELDAILEL